RDDWLADIGIKDGRITNIAQRLEGKAVAEIDAHCNLVTESFVNPHLHLCKVWTLPMMEEEALKTYHGEAMGKAMAGIQLASKIKEVILDQPDVVETLRFHAPPAWVISNGRVVD